ncbi:MAG: hypothetical protein H0W83_01775 [Planctomycetes bacterium]|nr:hypothetical protein [Planctomycetota bacterium]
MSRLILFSAAIALISSAALAVEPAPATVTSTKAGGIGNNGLVTSETIDGGIKFTTGEGAESSFAHNTYEVVYKPPADDVDYLKAERAMTAKDYAKAIESYRASAAKSKFDWVRQSSAVSVALCAQALKKPEDGIAAIQGLEKDYPKSVRLPEALLIKARLLADKGDKAEAVKVLTALAGHDKDWGLKEASKGATGLGEILVADQKFADAVALLSPWLAKIAKFPNDFATIGLLLGQAQAGSSAVPAALDTYRAVAFSAADPSLQARAHIEWSKLLAAKTTLPDLMASFDHAAIAALIKGVDGNVRGEALKVAKEVVAKIVAASPGNDDAKNKVKIEYTTYLGKLQ